MYIETERQIPYDTAMKILNFYDDMWKSHGCPETIEKDGVEIEYWVGSCVEIDEQTEDDTRHYLGIYTDDNVASVRVGMYQRDGFEDPPRALSFLPELWWDAEINDLSKWNIYRCEPNKISIPHVPGFLSDKNGKSKKFNWLWTEKTKIIDAKRVQLSGQQQITGDLIVKGHLDFFGIDLDVSRGNIRAESIWIDGTVVGATILGDTECQIDPEPLVVMGSMQKGWIGRQEFPFVIDIADGSFVGTAALRCRRHEYLEPSYQGVKHKYGRLEASHIRIEGRIN